MTDFSAVLPYALISLLGVFLSSVSQVMLKRAAMRKYSSVVQEYLNPLVIFAYGIFFSTTLLGILAYKGMPVSLGPVLETTAYFYITVFGVVIFKEKLNSKKNFGIMYDCYGNCCICAGMIAVVVGRMLHSS